MLPQSNQKKLATFEPDYAPGASVNSLIYIRFQSSNGQLAGFLQMLP
jgi:hypothetical protein